MNKFGTFLVSLAAALFVAAPAFAETDYVAQAALKDIQNGTATKNAIQVLYVQTSASVPDLSVTDDLTVAGDVISPAVSATATNGATLTLTSRYTLLAGTGQANNFTNTVTIADPGTAGITRTIMVTRASTNLILIAESADNVDLGAASREMDNLDNLTLFAETTTNWVEIGFVNN
jgi:hypothetical protein